MASLRFHVCSSCCCTTGWNWTRRRSNRM